MKTKQHINENVPTVTSSQDVNEITHNPRKLGDTSMESIANNGVISTPRDIKDVQVITHNSVPVVTTEMLAEFYGTESLNIQVNHARNKDRFIEGKHFFKAAGDDLSALRHTLSKSQDNLQISPKTRSLILWTEQGAARHAKMLETDKAWEVFEQLEECYFHQKVTPVVAALPQNYIEALECLVLAEKEKIAIAMERDHAISTKAEIGSRREATAMAKASVETKRANKLADQLGESGKYATVKAVERVTGKEYKYAPLRKFCKANGLIPNDVPDKTYGTVKAWPAEAWQSVHGVNIKKLFTLKAVEECAA